MGERRNRAHAAADVPHERARLHRGRHDPERRHGRCRSTASMRGAGGAACRTPARPSIHYLGVMPAILLQLEQRGRRDDAQRALRFRRRRRSAPPGDVRAALRLSADRGLGDDRDRRRRGHARPPAGRAMSASAASAAPSPAMDYRIVDDAGRGRRTRDARRTAGAPEGRRAAARLLHRISEGRGGDRRGLGRRLVPHRRRRQRRRGRLAVLRRPQEEHRAPLGREHRGDRGRGRARRISPASRRCGRAGAGRDRAARKCSR